MQTLRQRWKKTSLSNKALVVIGAIGLIGIVGVPVGEMILSEIHRKEDRRPIIINKQPPSLLNPIDCDTKAGSLHSGSIQFFAKNIGKTEAKDVSLRFRMGIVPLRKTGIPIYDEPPPVNCSITPLNPPMKFSLPPDTEAGPLLRQSVETLPPLTENEAVQLYATSCFYYTDDSHSNHSVCDTYIFILGISKESTFVCDGSRVIGKFGAALTGDHCAN